MKYLFSIVVLSCLFATPLWAHPDSLMIDSSEFRRQVHDEVLRTLRSLGIHTSEDSTQKDSSANHEWRDRRHTHEDSVRRFTRMAIIDRAVDPVPFSQWLPFEGFRYNRVDGLFLGIGSATPHSLFPLEHVSDSTGDDSVFFNDALRPMFNLGYSFGSHYWQTELGLSYLHRFTEGTNALPISGELGFEWHKRTDSRDGWIDDVGENTLFALIAHEDPIDYYFIRKGYSATARLYIGDEQLSAQYRNDNETSLHKREYWSLFGGKKLFHENWPIPEGTYKAVVLTSYFNNVNTNRLYRGWSLLAEAELGTGSYTFNQYTFDIRRYQPIARWSSINVRFRAGAVQGEDSSFGTSSLYFTPWQEFYHLGGIGSMPAFDYRELQGNRMMLFNAEWNFTGRGIDEMQAPSNDLTVMLLFDAGLAYLVDDRISASSGWNQMALRDFKSDIGFAIGSENGKFRFGWMWRTDRAAGGTFFLRLSRPF